MCRAAKNELYNIGEQRTFEEDNEKEYSCNLKPLLPIGRFEILAPSMHILHGILNRAMTILWANSGDLAKEMSYGIIGARPDAHTKQFCGTFFS